MSEEVTSPSKEFRPLPLEYSLYGNKFVQVKRSSKAAMYKAVDETSSLFEVFCIKIAKATIIKMNNSSIPERERQPGNEDFGKWAWTTRDEEKANLIYDEIEHGLRPRQVEEIDNDDPDNKRETD